jgi:3'-phosphoadenosine 5'-phosphosulfate (PAPS) 3'-phosphatase
VAVTNKADDSPVTAADLAAHRMIADGLLALAPQIPVLSEEDCNIPLASAPLAALVAGRPAGWHQGIHRRQ